MKNKINGLSKLFKEKNINTKHKQNLYYLLADVKNEIVKIENEYEFFIWENGTWEDGTWHNGKWLNGFWDNGYWKNGNWKNGNWKNGTWYYGTWYDGTWKNGNWEDGTWYNGKWLNGNWKKGFILNKYTNELEYSNLSPDKVEWSYSYQK